MQPLSVHHVSVNVAEVERSAEFYVGVLGLVRRTDRPELGVGGVWLDAGGQQVHLVHGEPAPSKGQHFAVEVADLDAVVAELRGRHVKVSDAFPVGSGRQAFLSDPDGNLVELHQRGAA